MAESWNDIFGGQFAKPDVKHDKLIAKAVECYTEKLEEENKVLKDIIRQIDDAFMSFNGKSKSTDDIINEIIDILKVYRDAFREEAP